MKKVLLYCILPVAIMCASCDQQLWLEDTAPTIPHGTIHVLSTKSGETLYANHTGTTAIEVHWKTRGLPARIAVMAELAYAAQQTPDYGQTVYYDLVPQHKTNTLDVYGKLRYTTDNDGYEIFTMPSVEDLGVNSSTASKYTIILTVWVKNERGEWTDYISPGEISGESTGMMSVHYLPGGCVVPIGQRLSDKVPCSVP